MAGGVTKAGNIKAQILIPSADLPIVQPNSNKPHQPKPAKSGLTKQNYVSSVTCKACIKLLQVRRALYPLLTLCASYTLDLRTLPPPPSIPTIIPPQQKVLKCALPVTVPAQTDPFQAYHAAADACLTTAADRVLFEVCDPLPGSPLVADANNQLSYLVAFSRLALGDIAEVSKGWHQKGIVFRVVVSLWGAPNRLTGPFLSL